MKRGLVRLTQDTELKRKEKILQKEATVGRLVSGAKKL